MSSTILIDNYDSFSYNLVHAIEAIIGEAVLVVKNDAIDYKEMAQFDHIILSPGPGLPEEAGQLKETIGRFKKNKKILGICLGLQAIGEVFGAALIQLENVHHGIQSEISQTDTTSAIFDGIPKKFKAGRYHSWIIDESTLESELKVTSRDQAGHIMSIQHQQLPLYAVQFHPESIMTPLGNQILSNFLKL